LKDEDLSEVLAAGRSYEAEHYCNYCNISLPNSASFCLHLMERHVTSTNKNFCCSICSFRSPIFKELETHAESHWRSNPCEVCGESTDSCGHRLDEIVQMKLSCDYCSYKDTTIGSFQLHCQMCSNNPKNENYKYSGDGRICHTCFQVFNNNLAMKRHVEMRHNGVDQNALVKKFVCDECGRRFISKCSLSGHKKIHKKKPGVLKTFNIVTPTQRLNGMAASPALSVRSNSSVVSIKANVVTSVNEDVVLEDMPDF